MSTPPGGPLARTLSFIRFSHTIFALPFALGAMVVAADGWPSWRVAGLIVVAMVFARTAAMAFNRLADWELDQKNPRTAGRHRLIPYRGAVALCIASALGFIGATWAINPLCFALSPVALAIVFFYSITKRFTTFCHFALGLALAVSPVGAWLAVTGAFALPPLILAAAVVLWVAGFDLIYATQDHDFDKNAGLHSMVVRLGVPRSLALAQWLHGAMYLLLLGFGFAAGLGWPYYAGMGLVAMALVYEHHVAKRGDIAAINDAFFTSNAFVGVVFITATLIDRLL